MTTVIKPSIGRVVWFYPGGKVALDSGRQPCSAQVAFVHSDSMINVGYFDADGYAKNATSVRLVQAGEAPPENGFFAMWMPYQQGQAAKTEAAEAAAKAATQGA